MRNSLIPTRHVEGFEPGMILQSGCCFLFGRAHDRRKSPAVTHWGFIRPFLFHGLDFDCLRWNGATRAGMGYSVLLGQPPTEQGILNFQIQFKLRFSISNVIHPVSVSTTTT